MKYVFHFDFVYSARWLLGWSIDGIDSFALQELLRLGKRYMWIMRLWCSMETGHSVMMNGRDAGLRAAIFPRDMELHRYGSISSAISGSSRGGLLGVWIG